MSDSGPMDDSARVATCSVSDCLPGNYGPGAIYHPGHGVLCPRRVPNVESFCTGCGVAINYHPHVAWCPLSRPAELDCGCSCTCEGKTHHWASCAHSSRPGGGEGR